MNILTVLCIDFILIIFVCFHYLYCFLTVGLHVKDNILQHKMNYASMANNFKRSTDKKIRGERPKEVICGRLTLCNRIYRYNAGNKGGSCQCDPSHELSEETGLSAKRITTECNRFEGLLTFTYCI